MSLCRLFSDLGSQAEVAMSQTLAASSKSMLLDDSLEKGGVNALGFLPGLHDTNGSSGVEAAGLLHNMRTLRWRPHNFTT